MQRVRTIGVFMLIFVAGWVAAADSDPAGQALPDELLQPLLMQYEQEKDSLGNSRYVALVNYRQPSWEPRFYLIDPDQRQVVAAYRVSHGQGSDPNHDGYADFFGNREGSHMSSVGFFLTGETYISEQQYHGLSLRLEGLSKTNHGAYERNIVIHANHYMEQHFIDTYGKPGRSHGCLVFAPSDRDEIVEKLKGGALIYAAR